MTKWLDEEQQEHWRAWITASQLLTDRLGRELHSATGLTLADYEILVRLSERPGRTMRLSELAEATLSSRSRLSHQVDRMETAGLVSREACEGDRRGFNAVMTDRGWDVLVDAAPVHVSSVRRHLVDVLSDEELAALGGACAKIVDHLPSKA